MSDSISLSVDYTTSNRKSASRTITNISASATDSELNSFVNDLYGLTTNSVGTVTRIAKRNLSDEPETPGTNPIQSITSNEAYVLTGSGTSYTATVDIAKLMTNVPQDEEYGLGVCIEVTLPVSFVIDTYAGKVSVKYNATHLQESTSENAINPGICFLPYDDYKMALYIAYPNLVQDVVGRTNDYTNTTITFDSVTVEGTKYAPWSVTFKI